MFYDRLKNICDSKGITVTFLLKSLNISTSKGTAWKNGSSPNSEIVKKIANYFNVTTDYLLGNEQSKAIELPALSENKQELLKIFDQLSDRNQLKALGAIENILNNQLETEQTKENVG